MTDTELDGAPVSPEQLLPLGLAPYGHFTSIRIDDRRAKGIGLHLERLARDCDVVFGAELDTGRVRELARRAVAETSGPLVIRITVFDPATELGHPDKASDPHVLVTKRPAAALPPSPLRAGIVVYERELPEVKHISLFGTMRARREAQQAGFDDAVFVSSAGYVSEGATWNIGFVRDGEVIWPHARVLPGVTAALLDRVHPPAEHVMIHRNALSALGDFDAAFATNTSIGVRPIVALDDAEFPADHPVLKQLAGEYAGIEPESF